MALVRWTPRTLSDPLSELFDLSTRTNRLFDLFPWRMPETESYRVGLWHPDTDIRETGEEIIVSIDLPGMSQKEIDISFDGHVLTIEGERKVEPGRDGEVEHLTERFRGRFHRVLHLPTVVDSEKVKASYDNGVLTVTLPKREEKKRKEVKVEVS